MEVLFFFENQIHYPENCQGQGFILKTLCNPFQYGVGLGKKLLTFLAEMYTKYYECHIKHSLKFDFTVGVNDI